MGKDIRVEIYSKFRGMSEDERTECLSMLLEDYFNSYGLDDKLAKSVSISFHRTIQQNFFRWFVLKMCPAWITAKKENRFDDRNKATVNLAQEIVAMSQFDNWIIPMI